MEILQTIVSAGETDLRLSFIGAIREVFATKPEEFDPRKILGPGREAIKETVQLKMRLFGSSGKGPKFIEKMEHWKDGIVDTKSAG